MATRDAPWEGRRRAVGGRARFFVLVALLGVGSALAGCASTELPRPAPPVSLLLDAGTSASYVIDNPPATVVPMTLRMQVTGLAPLSLSYAHIHPTRPEFDARVDYVMAPDGSQASATFDCMPTYPDERNRHCYKHLAGQAARNGAFGGFFGTTLLSGLQESEPGVIARTIVFGDFAAEARFKVERMPGGLLEVSAADEETTRLPFSLLEMNGYHKCHIFSGVVTFDPKVGLPTRCLITDDFYDEGEGVSYSLARRTAPGATGLTVVEPTQPANPASDRGARMPAHGPAGAMPFPFEDALARLAGEYPEFQEFLDGPHWIEFAGLQRISWSSTGDCATACVHGLTWQWRVTLARMGETIEAWVNKTVTSPGDLTTYDFPGMEVSTFPYDVKSFPAALTSFEEAWRFGGERGGTTPTSIALQPRHIGPEQSVLAPLFRVGFSPPRGEADVPEVTLWADGSLARDTSSGARAWDTPTLKTAAVRGAAQKQ